MSASKRTPLIYLFFLNMPFVRVGMLRRVKRKHFIYLFLSEHRLFSALFRSVTKVWCVADLFQWLYYFQDWFEYKTAFWKSGSKRWGWMWKQDIQHQVVFVFIFFKGERATVTLLVLMFPDLVKSVYIFLSSPSTLGYQQEYSRQALVEYHESSWFLKMKFSF